MKDAKSAVLSEEMVRRPATPLPFGLCLAADATHAPLSLSLSLDSSSTVRCPFSGLLPSTPHPYTRQSIFADQTHVKEMLHEYLRRVLLNKPDDPISFLMDEIKRNPFVIPTLSAMPDDRPEEEKAKYIDARPIEEKMSLLKVR